jgi:class 3 adenylate cyclase/tetratricopeptide (TPR) repeat protein
VDRRSHARAEGIAAAAAALRAQIPGDRRRALARGAALPDRVSGAALFADVSGFTPLTESLAAELGPQRGAEELTANLNRLFDALVDELDRFAGDVIYFGGDAVTCWFDGDEGERATACALAMQTAMDAVGEVVSPGGVRVRLALKAAVAVGAARRFVVGDPAIQCIDVLAGEVVDALSTAEQRAEPHEVVLDQSALRSLGDRVELRSRRVDPESGRALGVVSCLQCSVAGTPPEDGDEMLPDEVVAPWTLAVVRERLRAGRGEFLAELRPAVPMFIHFAGIDYDRDDDAVGKLDAIVRLVQRVVTSFGGNLLQLVLGDKGGYLFAVLGTPVAHEDDAGRAMAAALELRHLGATTAATEVRIGVSYGRLLSGMYGHRRRQAFSCLGDAVNLAARLMAAATPGAVYVSEEARRAAGAGFVWHALAPLAVKGKSKPVSASALERVERHGGRGSAASEQPLVGRGKELGALIDHFDAARAGRGRVVGVAAEAGMGKSRLVVELTTTAAQRRVFTAQGECYAYGTNTGYLPWRTVYAALFGLDERADPDMQIRSVEAKLAAIHPSFVARAPLLSGVLDLAIPENELTASMDPKLRKVSLEALLVDVLRDRAEVEPLVIVLEDCHWIDSLSHDLLVSTSIALADLPVLVVLAYRPAGDAGGVDRFHALANSFEVTLSELDAADAAHLVRSQAERMLAPEETPAPELVSLITARAQGNPFYIEELLRFIHDQGVSLASAEGLKSIELPGSLHSLMLSRIDTLDEHPRRTLKVASVLGRTFRMSMLPGIYPELGAVLEIEHHLDVLAASGLVHVDQAATDTYLFKHVVTQEVAYESMPFAFRSMLHERTAAYIEDAEADAIERHLDLLAHHYSRSSNAPKKREYLGRAGDAAQAQYANPAAIDYFERLLPLVEGRDRVEVLLKLGKVLELVGDWNRAERTDREALACAEGLDDEQSRATCETALAEVARKQGRFDEAVALLESAGGRYRSLGAEPGMARVLHLAGTIAAQRGEYDRAVESYEASLAIRERMGDKASMGGLLSNLGVVAEYRGDYVTGRRFYERALALRVETGDRWAIGVSMNNVGINALNQDDYVAAREWFTKSMQLCNEVGDGWMVAIGLNNLGNANRGIGDYEAARRNYADSVRAYRNYDDRWALAFLLEDIGILTALEGDPRAALVLIGAADALREAIQAPRAPAVEEDIQRRISASVATVPHEEGMACRARGRSLSLAEAISFAEARWLSPGDANSDGPGRASPHAA